MNFDYDGKLFFLAGNDYLTNRVFYGWWGDAEEGEKYVSEWASKATDESGEDFIIIWHFPQIKGDEDDPENLPWGETEYIHSIEYADD